MFLCRPEDPSWKQRIQVKLVVLWLPSGHNRAMIATSSCNWSLRRKACNGYHLPRCKRHHARWSLRKVLLAECTPGSRLRRETLEWCADGHRSILVCGNDTKGFETSRACISQVSFSVNTSNIECLAIRCRFWLFPLDSNSSFFIQYP